ncbi:MAG: hypothetical protein JO279_00385 [Verrucomicrobia bacterium]|nr:hypothetical protein [Verrucomicrobiota bacterium]
MSTGESEMHWRLKEQTFLWAYGRGFRCCATEVRAPRSRFRIDVAAIRLERTQSEHTVALFECKQSREDLDRDNQRHSGLSTHLQVLQERRDTLERLLALHYPSLRTTDSLFPEWATFDFSAIDHTGYRQTIRKIACRQRQLFEKTKFDLMIRYRLGNLHYLVTTPDLLRRCEVPLGWGLLELDGKEVITEKSAPTRFSGVEIRPWLERIAKASTLQNAKLISERCQNRSP